MEKESLILHQTVQIWTLFVVASHLPQENLKFKNPKNRKSDDPKFFKNASGRIAPGSAKDKEWSIAALSITLSLPVLNYPDMHHWLGSMPHKFHLYLIFTIFLLDYFDS